MSLEEELLYSTDSPIRTMKGLMKCHRGNLYPFGLFPERSKRMEGPSLEFTNDITILYGGNGPGKTSILNLIAESIKALHPGTRCSDSSMLAHRLADA